MVKPESFDKGASRRSLPDDTMSLPAGFGTRQASWGFDFLADMI